MDHQDTPIEDGHDDASTKDKLDGLVEQMRQDVAQGAAPDVEDALRQRLTDSGIHVDEQEFAALVARIRA
jgi:hypothetical protein